MGGVIGGEWRKRPEIVLAWRDPTRLACRLVGHLLMLRRVVVVGTINSLTKDLKPSAAFG